MTEVDIHTTVRGDVGGGAREYAERKVAALARLAQRPVLFARLELRQEPDPALERPSIAKASLDLSGERVRAHVAATTMLEAADALEARLRRRMEILEERREVRRYEPGASSPGRWRHGDRPVHRPSFFPRPVGERQLMRRATFGVASITPEEAVFELELLDHDFLLFDNAGDGDCAVYRRGDGGYGLILGSDAAGRGGPYVDWITVDPVPAPRLAVAQALERLDVSSEPFVFFVDEDRNRGAIVYRRYDGHHGLIEPMTGDEPGDPIPQGTGNGAAERAG